MDPQYEATSRVATTAVGPIHHHDHGAGDPLLMIHGSGPGVSGWANFSGNLATFGERYRCVVPDLPGFGRTPIAEGNRGAGSSSCPPWVK